MILRQKPPENFVGVLPKESIILQNKGYFPMYMWKGYHYYKPTYELITTINNIKHN